MTRHYITFSGDKYHDSTRRMVADAVKFGADKLLVYDDFWLLNYRRDFVRQNIWAWQHHKTRGVGWFIWKPYIIMETFKHIADGDIVLFTDGDTYPVADFSVLYDICARQGGIMVFAASGLKHAHWCKRDCYIVMNQDTPEYTGLEVQAGVARFMLFQKGPWRPAQFLMEWLAYCTNPLANTMDASVLAPEYPALKEHRCEQSILTNLALKYRCKLWREACQAGNPFSEDKDIYPQLFVQASKYSFDPRRGAGSCFRNITE